MTSGERVLRSAEFSRPYEYLKSLPASYTDEAGIRKLVPFSLWQMGVMQGVVDGLSEFEISSEKIGRASCRERV